MRAWSSSPTDTIMCRFFVPFALLSIVSPVLVHGQSASALEGFITIDCGKAKDGGYVDPKSNITYTSDFQFVETGEIRRVAASFLGSNHKSFDDVRFFPTGTRNCYSIPVKQGGRYAVAADFMYGDYDGKDSLPSFDLHLGANFWQTVEISNSSNAPSKEIMAIATSSLMQVCLVNTDLGTPFISALQVKPMPDYVYRDQIASQAWLLKMRTNYGGSRDVRYPDDAYDRYWFRDYGVPDTTLLNTTKSVVTSVGFEPPLKVMQTAMCATTKITLDFYAPTGGVSGLYIVIFHFAELLQLKENETRIFDVNINKVPRHSRVKPTYLVTTSLSAKIAQGPNYFEFSLVPTIDATLPPICNALEVYRIVNMTEPETEIKDADSIRGIKAAYHISRNWMGDPCAPKELIWNGLSCSNSSLIGKRIITSLNLSSWELSGEISASISNLTHLQYLDLSRNQLTGKVPDFLANLENLIFLNITGNKLTEPIPKALLDRSKAGTLTLSYDSFLSNSHPSPPRYVIVIVAVASIIFLAIVIAVICFAVSRWRKSHASTPKRDVDEMNPTSAAKPSRFLPRMMALHLDSKKFTFKELVKMTKNFKKEIGKGGYGPVYHGIWKGNVQVAVKMLSHNSSQGPEEFQTEAGLLTRIHHRNLVPLVGYCCDGHHLALVYQFMAEGSLKDHLSGKVMNARFHVLEERLRIALEAALGLEYLHNGCTPAIIHRDIKTSNILLNEDLEAKIADFGFSRILPDDYINHVTTKVVGSHGYLDPEYYNTCMLNEKTDVYSFGIVLLELVTGLPAIVEAEGRRHIVQLVKPFFERGQIDAVVDERLRGDYDINSVWKAVETALLCSSSASTARPAMSDVVVLLKEALGLEIARRGDVISSKAAKSVSRIYGTDSDNVSAINVPSPR